jgi:hypothetical protein
MFVSNACHPSHLEVAQRIGSGILEINDFSLFEHFTKAANHQIPSVYDIVGRLLRPTEASCGVRRHTTKQCASRPFQAARRRRRESPLTDPGDPPAALGPNARLLAAYSTPGGLLHAAGIDPGFALPAPNVVGSQLPGAPETTGTGSGEVRRSPGFVPVAPGLLPPGMPAWSLNRQPPVSLVPNGRVKGKRRKVVQANGSSVAQLS